KAEEKTQEKRERRERREKKKEEKERRGDSRLKQTGESFIQDAACHELAGFEGINLNGPLAPPRCRECRSSRRKDNTTVFCRFYGFQKLSFLGDQLQTAGFCDPEDCARSDLALWLPSNQATVKSGLHPQLSSRIELDACRYILDHIGGLFCELVQQEKEALSSADCASYWKRPIPGVREMCDACETTLFNLHWVCSKCGFGVCCDCYKGRRGMATEESEAYDMDKSNSFTWLKCSKGKPHIASQLIPTQIIPSVLGGTHTFKCVVGGTHTLYNVCLVVHTLLNVCETEARTQTNVVQPRLRSGQRKFSEKTISVTFGSNNKTHFVPICTLNFKSLESTSYSKSFSIHIKTDIRSMLLENDLVKLTSVTTFGFYQTIIIFLNNNSLFFFGLIFPPHALKGDIHPSPTLPPAPSSHTWLCDRELLQLIGDCNETKTFQKHWFYGMPVVASGAEKKLTPALWKPSNISAEHGHEPTGNALINCRRGSVITNAFIRDFWNGFESIENRLTDDTGVRMILKLKDWPTTDDFLDTMPHRFKDLMAALPLPEYTSRDGTFNITSYLPNYFVRPDLGPKMYIAYGGLLPIISSQSGTTNLHLDISDACNLMVYVGIIKEGDADAAQIERARKGKPGALWHIFKASDTDKIRQLILKIKHEKGMVVPEGHDPIHDQEIYLDKQLRRRLKTEYGVEGYPIVQCEGDSVFIPAGAPHQVFNLHSCIKVAEDFVSPEHVDKCFKLTNEFRALSSTHSNHEDKLQLKNIIYHTVKE
uniref:JmjC domain-containing protein n=1 Tax=Ciona savignyi TaxID=51511 RepID=H2YD02_CIOSA